MNPLQDQLTLLKAVYGEDAVTTSPSDNGATLITINNIPLPNGWNKQTTSVSFVAPVGYPFAAPDCFWAQGDLRLNDNALPQAAQNKPIPGTNENGLWFSWHIKGWNPSQNNLVTYAKVIEQRFMNLK